MPSMRFMVNLPPHAKSTLGFMKTLEIEKGFLRPIQRFMLTSVLFQRCFRVVEDPRLIPSAVFRFICRSTSPHLRYYPPCPATAG